MKTETGVFLGEKEFHLGDIVLINKQDVYTVVKDEETGDFFLENRVEPYVARRLETVVQKIGNNIQITGNILKRMETEEIVTSSDNQKDKVHFVVPMEWLDNLLLTWSEKKAEEKNLENDKDYIRRQADILYDEALYNKSLTVELLDKAKEDGVILNLWHERNIATH